MIRFLETKNVLPIIVPMADIQYETRENLFHQGIEGRKLHILRPYSVRPIGDMSNLPPLPLIIYIGGGAWKSSTPWMHMPELCYYVNHGYIVASIDYSTVNFEIFPSQIESVKAAIRFLRKNSAKFGIDSNRIALMGDSAGAQLAALAGTTCSTGLFSKGDNLEISDEVDAVVDFYGPVDFTEVIKNSDTALYKIYMDYLGDGDMATIEKNAAAASAVTHISKNTPPFLILHGTEDTMVDPSQSKNFYERLVAKGVEAELVLFPGADHADLAFVQEETLAMILEFLDKYVKNK